MRKSARILPLVLLLAAYPAAAQEVPRVLFCMGECFGVDDKGTRIPVTKGTELAPGLRLETGPNSYAQVKLGRDSAFGIGERARVRFDRRVLDRDIVILDQGRIRIVGGEAIGRPGTRPVELQTIEGNIVLRNADIEVKTLPRTTDTAPAPTLVKLNLGDARIGELPVTKDAVRGFAGGKLLEKAIPIGDIALTPRRDVAPAPGTEPRPLVKPTLPSIGLPLPETKLSMPPQKVLVPKLDVVAVKIPYTKPLLTPVVTLPERILAQPLDSSGTDKTSLNTMATTLKKELSLPTTSPSPTLLKLAQPVIAPPPPTKQQLIQQQQKIR
jgi:hypothetical protein